MTKENRDKPIEFPKHVHEGKRPALLIPYTSNTDALRSIADLLTCGHAHIFIVNQETSNLEVSVLAETCIIQGRLKENPLLEKFGRAGIVNPNEGTVTIKLLHNHPSVDPCDEKCPLFRVKMDNPTEARLNYDQPPVPDQPRLRHNHGFSDACDSRCPVFRAVTVANEDPIPSPFEDDPAAPRDGMGASLDNPFTIPPEALNTITPPAGPDTLHIEYPGGSIDIKWNPQS